MIENSTIGMKTSSRRRMPTPKRPSRRAIHYARFSSHCCLLLGRPFFEVRYFGRTFDRSDGSVPRDQQRARDLALPGRVDLESEAFDKAVVEKPVLRGPEPGLLQHRARSTGQIRNEIGADHHDIEIGMLLHELS